MALTIHLAQSADDKLVAFPCLSNKRMNAPQSGGEPLVVRPVIMCFDGDQTEEKILAYIAKQNEVLFEFLQGVLVLGRNCLESVAERSKVLYT